MQLQCAYVYAFKKPTENIRKDPNATTFERKMKSENMTMGWITATNNWVREVDLSQISFLAACRKVLTPMSRGQIYNLRRPNGSNQTAAKSNYGLTEKVCYGPCEGE